MHDEQDVQEWKMKTLERPDSEIKRIADDAIAMSRKGDEKWLDCLPDGLSKEDNEKLTEEVALRIVDDWNHNIKHPCCCKLAEATSIVDDEGLFTPSEVSQLVNLVVTKFREGDVNWIANKIVDGLGIPKGNVKAMVEEIVAEIQDKSETDE